MSFNLILTFPGEGERPKKKWIQKTSNDIGFSKLAAKLEMGYDCEVGDESHTKKVAEKLITIIRDYYTRLEKGPSESNDGGQSAWECIKEELPGIAMKIRKLLIADENFCKTVDGKVIFISRRMEGKEAQKPGTYLRIKLDMNPPKNKIGMSNEAKKGTYGRVERQIPSDVRPQKCSALLVTRDEAVDIVNRSPELKDKIERILQILPAFQSNQDKTGQAFDELVNEMMEFTLTAMLTKSNGYETELGIVLERLHNVGSTFINEHCQFPSADSGNNGWIIDFLRRTISLCADTTWSTVHSDVRRLLDSCDDEDEDTIRGMAAILKDKPLGGYLTRLMYLILLGVDPHTGDHPLKDWGDSRLEVD